MARVIEFDEVEILEKAKKVFWRNGYHATSMRDLVKATGLNPGSIYNTYGGKHELFLQCLKNYVAPAARYNPADEDEGLSALDILEKFIVGTITHSVASSDACMSAKSCFELAAADKEVHDILKLSLDNLYHTLGILIRNVQVEGGIPAEREPEMLARLIAATLPGFAQNFILYNDRREIRKLTRQLIDLIRR
jgi:TetR/AcrR family transcriptional repressor of nem operon